MQLETLTVLATLATAQASAQVTITRDNWGIAHVHGHTDGQAVFGVVYAQAEDDFNRIEMNYLTALGRLSETEGEATLAQDLRARLYVDPADLHARYVKCPLWLQGLMRGWADGLNAFLATHPAVHPKVLKRFEPWMALAFSEGSIGGDIERVPLAGLAAFYGLPKPELALLDSAMSAEPTGSNGIAVAAQNTRDHHALLLINPHTSFYFRSELQMASDEGLDAYGAATWGQFFLYQGFNQHLGWMHTSSTSDAVDFFQETIVRRRGALLSRYGDALRPVTASKVTLGYRKPDGSAGERSFTIYKSTHGPVIGKMPNGRWTSVAMMFRPEAALEQSFSLTKAVDFASYMKAMAPQANTSNNTVYADAGGNIAYLHPQFIPRRDARFDYTQPVDGADPHTDWHGLHTLDEVPHLFDPATGWIQNTNNWPYSASGSASPRAQYFPRYMDTEGENMRGLHATALLQGKTGFTLEWLVRAAFDSAQPGFDMLIPHLVRAFDDLAKADSQRTRLAGQIDTLRHWDRRWAADSISTTLAVTWGEALWRAAGQKPHSSAVADYDAVLAHTTPSQMLAALAEASDALTRDFGTWRTPWGEVNRFQRRTDDLVQPFSDAAPSLPVAFTSGQWGSLAAISGPQAPALKHRYGSAGNSFVAAVEFGPRVRAVAVSAGGESGDPGSPHFDDQAAAYVTGTLRPVYFYPDELAQHISRTYKVE